MADHPDPAELGDRNDERDLRFRGADGYKNPSDNYAYYAKTRRLFASGRGDFSLGAYVARSSAQRPFPIPVAPIPGITITGPGNPGALISQQTTGYYTTLPYSVNWKLDTNITAAGAFNQDSYTAPNGSAIQTGNTNIPAHPAPGTSR